MQFTTSSPAWIVSDFENRTPLSLLEFDYEFTSAAESSAVLSFYLNGELLGIIDQRFAPAGLDSYSFAFPELGPGIQKLGIRLDAYGSISAIATVSNFHGSFAQVNVAPVPEPSGVSLLSLGVLSGIAFNARRGPLSRRKHP